MDDDDGEQQEVEVLVAGEGGGRGQDEGCWVAGAPEGGKSGDGDCAVPLLSFRYDNTAAL